MKTIPEWITILLGPEPDLHTGDDSHALEDGGDED
jgi:hypothetical protein